MAESYRFIVAVGVDPRSGRALLEYGLHRDGSGRETRLVLRGQRCLPELQSGGEGIAAVGSHTVVIAKFAQALDCLHTPSGSSSPPIAEAPSTRTGSEQIQTIRRLFAASERSNSGRLKSAGRCRRERSCRRFDQCGSRDRGKVGDTLQRFSMASICCSIGSVHSIERDHLKPGCGRFNHRQPPRGLTAQQLRQQQLACLCSFRDSTSHAAMRSLRARLLESGRRAKIVPCVLPIASFSKNSASRPCLG